MNINKLIKVIIIEDDDVLRNAYETLINRSEKIQVITTYQSCSLALKCERQLKADIILLDIEMEGINGIDAIPSLKKMYPRASIIMLTVFDYEKLVFNALNNGAAGYLTKNSTPLQITNAIIETFEGGSPMSTSIARIVVGSFHKNFDSPLSKRESQILELIGEGKNRSEIAEILFIDVETVKSHIKNIYLKLEVNSKSQAIDLARKKKLIS